MAYEKQKRKGAVTEVTASAQNNANTMSMMVNPGTTPLAYLF